MLDYEGKLISISSIPSFADAIYYSKTSKRSNNLQVEILLPRVNTTGEGRSRNSFLIPINYVRDGVENSISRSALGGSLEQFPGMGVGPATESFANINTPRGMGRQALAKQRSAYRSLSKTQAEAVKTVRGIYRRRFWAHVGFIGLAAGIIVTNSPTHAHNLSVRLMSAHAAMATTLDDAATAKVAADMAVKSHLLITSDASKTATVKSQQIALLTSDDGTLAKRQVVSTAGNATRDISTYAVLPGDTLSGVASKFNISTSTIKWANDMSSIDAISPGQSLTILPVSGLVVTVAAGDTADTLAAKYNANAAQITSFNNAEVTGLPMGQKIIVPDGTKADAPKPLSQVATARSGSVAGSSSVAPRLTNFAFGGNGYSYGYCTYYVASRRAVPSSWGNANQWLYYARASGFSTGSVPVAGAIAWTGYGYYGHVAYVEYVSGNMVTVSEMNYNGNWNRATSRTVPASTFSYIY